MRVGIITLGCDKNTVDNEYLAGLLEDAGCEVVFAPDLSDATPFDAVVVTTCGFTADAKEQSVEALVALAEAKRETGNPRRLLVAGCLAQRYAQDLLNEIPEIDALVGVGQFDSLAEMVVRPQTTPAARVLVNPVPSVDIDRFMRRRRTDDKPYAFLKIADGCNHTCSFCAIPLMKGRLRSVPREIILHEARALLRQGVRELNLIAQDVSVYGRDRGSDYRLPHLLRDLCALDGDFWVRCLYCYPGGITDELISVMAEEPKIVPYLDIPLQHVDPDLLRRMNRPDPGIDAVQLVERLRARVPNIAIRTTMLVGLPGETPKAHRRMLEGIRRLSVDWLGAFQYSREEGTPAAAAPRQVGKATRDNRRHTVMQLQAEITAQRNRARIGTRTKVLVEHRDDQRDRWVGRSPREAPEIDGVVYVQDNGALCPGRFVMVEIDDADVYDVFGRAAVSTANG
jgi:ribosomal protein S12 methylthiotransferase